MEHDASRPRTAPTRTLFDPSAVMSSSSSSANAKAKKKKDAPTPTQTQTPTTTETRRRRPPQTQLQTQPQIQTPNQPIKIEQRSVSHTQNPLQPSQHQHTLTPTAIARPVSIAVQPAPSSSASTSTYKVLVEGPNGLIRLGTPVESIPPSVLSDAPGCYIVGVLGRKGVGKSTILNLLAASKVGPFSTKSTTRGVDLHATGDGIVLLDMQAIFFPITKKPKKGEDHFASTIATQLKMSEKLALFMFSVCHVILVVSSGSSARDEEMWAFLRRMENIKYRADGGTGPIDNIEELMSEGLLNGKQRRQRRRRRNPQNSAQQVENEEDDYGEERRETEDGAGGDDNEAADRDDDHPSTATENESAAEDQGSKRPLPPRNKKPTKPPTQSSQPLPNPGEPSTTTENIFFPSLIFIHNRAKPSEFGENTHLTTRNALSRAFRTSRLQVFSNILSLELVFPDLYPSIANDLAASPNFWVLPPFPQHPLSQESSSAPSMGLLERLAGCDSLRSFLKDTDGCPARYQVLCEMLRDAVLEVPRYPFELGPPLSTVYKSFDNSGVAGTEPGGLGGMSGVVPGKKWFQGSEREWGKSVAGIWNALE
ncbi:hypothetical protein BCR33DRAFT_724114 [Rhizoclosmatium globosum]|uniref:G domain-containing protein n=1 Tax=Rhizoclosmatium globosum TaxID=329046 RepID=A0A1Y2B8L7_9FUNG|nr:hypothetical protein BCR33DRAFT_724114 [Rhizoclosmatium globosum]|eukprot:ORY31188.1 hypothetical protein BCR33DRAFT_724114 [Rhizoclosmatium globosum]